MACGGKWWEVSLTLINSCRRTKKGERKEKKKEKRKMNKENRKLKVKRNGKE